jgi:hypothetical protein
LFKIHRMCFTSTSGPEEGLWISCLCVCDQDAA